jgi:iron complex outermembrane receptor protein
LQTFFPSGTVATAFPARERGVKSDTIRSKSIVTMKTRLLSFILSCSAACSFGQAYIKGSIKDRQQSLPSATVLLLTSDSALIKKALTDPNGEFIFLDISPGHYLVSSSAIGYAPFVSRGFFAGKNNIVLPDIILEGVATELNAVVIKTRQPLIEQKTDRLVVNVQGTLTSSGNTILEVRLPP